MCSPINGGDNSRSPGDPNPPLPHLWHLIHLLSHSTAQLLDSSRLSREATPENEAAYELNRVAVRAWLAHLLRVVRTPVHATKQLVTLDDLQVVWDILAGVNTMGDTDSDRVNNAKASILSLFRRGVRS